MIDKNMIALAEIRYGYTLPKYGNLTLEQNSLIKYDNLCLNLIKENQKYKEVIDKLKFIKNRKNQGASQENVNKMAIEFVNSWLKEVSE